MKFSPAFDQQAKSTLSGFAMAFVFVAMLAAPEMVLAQDELGGADEKVCGFFGSINTLLQMGSIGVVTIAVIVAGYQIAFAHKRIADVAPILIGGVLIGAAGQIAKMLIGDEGEKCGGTTTTGMLLDALRPLYA